MKTSECTRTATTRAFPAFAMVLVLALVSTGCDRDRSNEASPDSSASAASAESEENGSTRIVSLGGTVTEIVYALGSGDDVVAVDASSVYPERTKEVRELDLFRDVSAEAVLSYDPTHVLATKEAKPPGAFERMEEAGVEVRRFASAETVESARARIRAVGDALGRSDEAAKLVEKLESDLEEAKKVASSCESPAETLFLYARGRGTTFVAGTGTSAERMIELAGSDHVPEAIEDFKPLAAEALVDTNPDVVLMTSSGLKSMGGISGLADVKGLSETPAITDERVVTMGDLELLGFGPRTGEVVAELSRSLCLSDGGGDTDVR